MAEKLDTSQDTDTKGDGDKPNRNAQGVVDYLQAPRKKRKNFIVVATGPSGDNETTQAIVRFVKQAYPKYAVATPQTPEDFLRQFSRNIVLAIISDEFVDLDGTLNLVKLMKEQKNESAIPVLFLTKNPVELIKAYSQKLAAWHEVDEYIVPSLAPRQYLFAKIKSGVEDRYRRKSRRFKIDFPVVFSVLNQGERKLKGTIVDMSVHGAQLKVGDDYIFNPHDQLLLHMPYGKYIRDSGTDVIRVAAKVKRIFISGDRAGLAWEYLTELKLVNLSRMLLAIVDTSLGRQANAARARIAKADAEAAIANNRGGAISDP